MILINGRGQLGDELLKYVNDVSDDYIIYHTWNFLNKEKEIQEECLKKFCYFLNTENYTDKKIVFISTYTNTYTDYLKYKMKAEFALFSVENSMIFRLPNILGKGLCEKFKNDEIKPDNGNVELITVQDAASKIVKNLNSKEKIIRITGTVLPVKLLYDIIKYGQN